MRARETCLEVTFRRGRILAAYLYLYLAGAEGTLAARSEKVSPGMVVDYAADGSPMGIELIAPALVTAEKVNELLERLGVTPLHPEELRPFSAA